MVLWQKQLGTTIADGEQDFSGYSVSISKNGLILALGAPKVTFAGEELNDDGQGVVRIFTWSHTDNDWVQMGQDLRGYEEGGMAFGNSVALSDNGLIIAVGSPTSTEFPQGFTCVYKWNGSSSMWELRGKRIVEGDSNDKSGHSVSISRDGETLAVGCYQSNPIDPNGYVSTNRGHVLVYNWDENSDMWVIKGTAIEGARKKQDQFGYSVSLSSDGSTVAVGTIRKTTDNPNGHVYVYKWELSVDPESSLSAYKWVERPIITNLVDVSTTGNQTGASVSLSFDGLIMAVGSPKKIFLDDNVGYVAKGQVQVYIWNEDTNAWEDHGVPIPGERVDEGSGTSVSLSDDGEKLAIGSPGTFRDIAGKVRIYEWNSGLEVWDKNGEDVTYVDPATSTPSARHQGYGYSVSLSSDGTTVVVGMSWRNSSHYVGQVEVYSDTVPVSSLSTLSWDTFLNINNIEIDGTVGIITVGVENDQQVTVSLNNKDYNATVEDDAATVTISSVDLKTLLQGPEVITTSVSNAAGTRTSTEIYNFTVDTVAPSIEAINTSNFSWGEVLNAAEADTVQTVTVNTIGVENDQDVTITLNSTNYTSEVLENVATVPISTVGLQGLEDGVSYTLTANVSDAAGNPAATVTSDSFSVDTSVPSIGAIVMSWGEVLNAAEAVIEQTVTVNTTGVEDGRNVTITLNSANYTSTVLEDEASVSITTAGLQGLTDGVSYTLTANVSDAAGNPAPEVSASFSVDISAPTMVITAAGVETGAKTNNPFLLVTFTSSETTLDFAAVDISVTNGMLSSFTGLLGKIYTAIFTPQSDGVCTIDVSAATFTDAAGNSNAAAARFVWEFDSTPPNLSNVAIASNNTTPTLAKADDVVTLTFTADETIGTPVVTFQSGSAAITDTQIVYINTSGTIWTAAYTVDASDTGGSVTYSIAFSDSAGNAGTAVTSGTGSVTFDEPPSVVSFAMNKSALKKGDTSTVTLVFSEAVADFNSNDDITAPNGTLDEMTSSDNGVTWTGTFAATNDIEDSTNMLTLAATYTDSAGNPGPSSTTGNYKIDTSVPSIGAIVMSWGEVLNAAEAVIEQTVTVNTTGVEDGQDVTITLNSANYTSTVLEDEASVSITTAGLQGLTDGQSYTLTANVSDAAGNPAPEVSASFSVDISVPSIGAIVMSWGEVLNAAEAVIEQTVTVNTTGVEDNQTVTIALNGNDYTSAVSEGVATVSISTVRLQGLTDGQSYTLTANVSDAAGNPAPEVSASFSVDISVPSIGAIVMSWGEVLNAAEAVIEQTVTVNTTGVEDNQTVTIALNGNDYTSAVSEGVATVSISTVRLQGLTDGQSYTLTANVSDAAGNPAPEVSASFSVDISVPSIEAINTSDFSWGEVLNAAEAVIEQTVSVNTTGVEDGQDVTITLNSVKYTSTVLENVALVPITTEGLQGLTDGGSYTLTANVSDAAGNPAATVTSDSFSVDTSVPSIGAIVMSWGEVLNAAEAVIEQTVTVNTTGVEDNQTVTIALNGNDYTSAVSEGVATVSISTVRLQGLTDGQSYTLTANVSDDAGNPAPEVSASFSVDISVPSIGAIVMSWGEVLNAAEAVIEQTVTVNTTGVEDNQTVTIALNGNDYTSAVSEGVATVSISTVRLQGLTDGQSYTLTANVSDAAGNPAPEVSASFSVDISVPSIGAIVMSWGEVLNAAEAVIEQTVTVNTTGVEDNQTVTIALNGNDYTSAVSEGVATVSISTVRLQGLTDGQSYTLTANVSDAAGNPAPEVSASFSVDISVPSIGAIVMSWGEVLNAAEAVIEQTVTVNTTGVEDNQTVTIALNGNDYTSAVSEGVATVSISTVRLQGLTDGQSYTLTANVSDAAGNPVPEVSASFSVDISVPSIGAIVMSWGEVLNAAEAVIEQTVTVNTTGVEDNQTVTIALNGNDYTSAVSEGVATVSISTVRLQGLTDGQSYTLTANVSDAAGNPAPEVSASFSVDISVPSIGAIVMSWGEVLNAAEAVIEQTVTVNTTGVEDNQTVTIALNGNDYTSAVSEGVATVSISTVRLQGLTDGQSYTLTANVSDAAGNPAPEVSASFSVDISVPSIEAINTSDFSWGEVLNAAEAVIEQTVTVNTTGVEDGQDVTITLNSVKYTSTVLENVALVPITTEGLQGLTDGGSYTLTANVSDAAGNPAATVTSDSFSVDTSVPSIGAIVMSWGEVLNAAEAVIEQTVTVNTTGVEDNQTVTITLNGNDYTSAVSEGVATVSISTVRLQGLTDGQSYTLTANVSDDAGNPAPEVSASFSVDISVPSIGAIVMSWGEVLNAAEAVIEQTVTVNTTGVEDNQTVTIALNGNDYTSAVSEGVATVSISTVRLQGLTDGQSYTLTANVSDAAGNPAPEVSASFSVDISVPSIGAIVMSWGEVLNAAEAVIEQTVTVNTTGVEDNQTVTIALNGNDYTSAVSEGVATVSISTVRLQGLTDGQSYTLTANVSDAAGNPAPEVSASFSVDISVPSIGAIVMSWGEVLNAAEAVIEQTVTVNTTGVEDNQTVTIALNGNDYTSAVSEGVATVSISTVRLQGLTDGQSYTLTANVSDAAGNPAPEVSASFSVDISVPSIEAINTSDFSWGEVLNAAEAVIEQTVTVNTTGVEDGQDVTITLNSVKYTSTVLENVALVPITTEGLQGLTDGGSYTLTANVSDAAGNPAATVTSDSFSVDTSVPSIGAIVMSWGEVLNAAEAVIEQTVTVNTTGVEDNQTVTITLNGNDYTSAVSEGVATVSISTVRLQGLTDGQSYTLTANVSDDAGNPAPEVSASFSVDISVPSIGAIVMSWGEVLNAAEAVIEQTVTVNTTGVEDNQTVTIALNGNDYTSAVSEGVATVSISTVRLQGLTDGQSYTLTANVSDAAGNPAPEVSASFSVDISVPSIGAIVMSWGEVLNAAEAVIEQTVTVNTTGVEDNQTVTIALNGNDYTSAVSEGVATVSISTVRLQGLTDGQSYTLTANVSDAAGNPAPEVSASFSVDISVPSIGAIVMSWGEVLNAAEAVIEQTVTVNTTGVEDNQTVTIALNGNDYTSAVSEGVATVSISTVRLQGLTDGQSYTLTANVSDAAGNPAPEVSASFSVDISVPSIEAINTSDFSWGEVLNAAEAVIEQTVSVNTTGVEDGQDVTITLNSVKYTSTVLENVALVPITTEGLQGLTDGGSYTLTANVSDAAGNPAATVTSDSFSVDTSVPSIGAIVMSWGEVLNAAEAVIEQTVTVNTTGVEDNQTVTIALNGNDYTSAVSEGVATVSISTVRLQGLTDGQSYTLTANVSDAAGNPAPEVSASFSVDISVPSIGAIVMSWGEVLNAAEAVIEQTVTVNTTGVEDNQTVTIALNGNDYTSAVSEGVATVSISTVRLQGLTDGQSYTLTANVSDAAGNPAPEVSASFSVDISVPSIGAIVMSWGEVLNAAEAVIEQTVTVNTTGVEDNQTVTIALNGNDYTSAVSEGVATVSISTVRLQGLTDGQSYTLTANVSDAAGNPAPEVSASFSVDISVPSIGAIVMSWGEVLNAAEAVIEQTVTVNTTGVEDNQTVTIALNGNDYTSAVSEGVATVSISTVRLQGLTDGQSYTLTANVSDAAGNPVPEVSASFSVDISVPSIGAIVMSWGEVLNAAEAVIEQTVTVNTTGVEDNQTVTIALNGNDYTSAVSEGVATVSISTVRLQGLTDGQSYTLTANVSDAAGNPAPEVSASFSVDISVPSIGAIVMSWGEVLNAAEAVIEQTVTVNTTGVEDNQTVTIALNGNDYTSAVSEGVATVSISTVRLQGLTDGQSYTLTANVSDAAGNPAPEVSASFSVDISVPSIGAIVMSWGEVLNAAEAVIEQTVTVNTTGVEDNQTVTIALNGNDYTSAVSEGVATVSISTVRLQGLTDGQSYTLTANVSDAAGNPAPEVSASFSVDISVPSIGAIVMSWGEVLNAAEAVIEQTVTVNTTGVEDNQTVTIALNGNDYTSAVSEGVATVSISTVRLQGLTDGQSYTLTANVSDAVGNPAPEVSASFSVDISVPSIEAINTSDFSWGEVLNAAEAVIEQTVTVNTTGVEDGQDVTITLNSVKYTSTVLENVALVPITTEGLQGLTDGGSYTLTANVSDAAGNPAATVTSDSFSVDTSVPSIGAIVMSWGEVLNAAEAVIEQTVTVNTTGVEDNQTVTITLNGNDYTSAVSEGVATVSISTVRLQGLTDGQSYTLTANVSDDAGNPAPEVSASFSVDISVPSIGAIVMSWGEVLNAAEAVIEQTVTVNTTGVEDNQTVTIALNGNDYTSAVSEGVATVSISTVRLQGLTDGQSYTLTANVSDAAGNPAPEVSASFSVDISVPSIGAIVMSWGEVLNAAEAVIEQTVTVNTTGVEDNQTVTIALNGNDYTSAVSEGVATVSISTVRLQGLTDGQSYTLTANVSDAAGNPAPEVSASFSVDISVPSIGAIVMSWGEVLNAAEAVIEQTVTVNTTGVEDNQTVTIALNGNDYTSAVSEGVATVSISTVRLQGLTDGQSYTLTANVSDAAGNPAPEVSASFSVDISVPSIEAINTSDFSWGEVLNAAEAVIEQTVSVNTTGVEDGQDVTITLNSVKYTSTVLENVALVPITTEGLQGLTDGGSYTLTANVSDAAGNPAATVTSDSFSVDTSVPSIGAIVMSWGEVLNAAEAVIEQTVTVNTTGVEDNQTVTIALNGNDYTSAVSEGVATVSISTVRLQGLTDGQSYTLTANVSDAAGNPAPEVSASFSVDISVPSIGAIVMSWGEVLNAAEAVIEQTVTVNTTGVEDNQTVTIALNGNDYTSAVSEGVATVSISTVRLQGLTDGQSYTLTANVSDAAGNPAPEVSASFSVDISVPSIGAIVMSWGEVLNAAEAVIEQTVTVNTTGVEDNQTVTIALNGNDYTSAVSEGVATVSISTVRLQGLTDGQSYTLTANVSDAAGNPAPEVSASFSVDISVPSIGAIVMSWGEVLNAAEAVIEQTVTVNTTGVEDNQTVTIALNGNDYTSAVSEGVATVSISTVRLQGLTDGQSYTLTANVSDAAGNPAPEVSASFSVDISVPSIGAIVMSWGEVLNAAEAVIEQTVTVNTTGVEDNQTVTIALNGNDYTSAVSEGVATVSISTVRLQGLTDGQSYTLTANVSDAAGNPAPEVSASFSVDISVPSIEAINTSDFSWGEVLNAAEAVIEQTVSVNTTGVEDGQDVTITLNSVKYTSTVLENVALVPITTEGLQGLTDGGSYTLTANVSDAAGNPAATVTSDSFSVDTSVPSIGAIVMSWGEVLNAAEAVIEQTVTVNTTGVEDNQTVTIALNGNDYTSAVSEGVATVSISTVRLQGLTDGQSYTLTANVSDDAGNPAPEVSASFSVDISVPSIGAIVMSWGEVLNAAEAVIEQTVTVNTTGVEDNQTVTIALNGNDYTSAVSEGVATVSISTVRLQGLTDGQSYTLTANVSDAAGNPAPEVSASFSVDISVPSIGAIVMSWGEVLNAAEAVIEQTVTVNTTGVEDNQTVTIALNGNDYTSAVSEGVATVSISTVRLQGLTDGQSYTLTANVSDAAGNPAPEVSASFSVDISVPSIGAIVMSWGEVLNAAEAVIEQTVTVNTTGVEDNQTVTIALNGNDYTSAVSEGVATVSISTVRLQGLTDGQSYTLTANVSDAAGNPAPEVSASFSVDISVPSIGAIVMSWGEVLNAAEAVIEQTVTVNTTGVEDNQTVTIALNGNDYTSAVSEGVATVSISTVRLQGLTDGQSYTLTANVSDAAGNPAPEVSASFSVDISVPSIGAIVMSWGEVLNAAEAVIEQTVTVNTTGVEDGQDVTITLNSANYTSAVSEGVATVPITKEGLQGLTDGVSYTLTANVSDAAGNPAPEVSASFSVDISVPSIGAIVMSWGLTLNSAEAVAEHTVTVNTTGVEDGQNVTIILDGKTFEGEVLNNIVNFTIHAVDLQHLTDGQSYKITANVSDAAGNPSTAFESSPFNVDKTSNIISIVSSWGEVLNKAEMEIFGKVTVNTDGVGDGIWLNVTLNSKVYMGRVSNNKTVVIITATDLQALAEGTEWNIRVDVTDVAGNNSTDWLTFQIDKTAEISVSLSWGDTLNTLEINRNGNVVVTTTGVENGQMVTVNLNQNNYIGIVNNNSVSVIIPAGDLRKLPAGDAFASVHGSDMAGNPITKQVSFSVVSTGGYASGDPYITPFYGPKYKLPDRYGLYRYISSRAPYNKRFTLDVDVLGLTKKQQREGLQTLMRKYKDCLVKYNKKVVLDGFFFRHYMLTNKGEKLLVDTEANTINNCPVENFKVAEDSLFTVKVGGKQTITMDSRQGKTGIALYTVSIATHHETYGDITIELYKFENPQWRNGIMMHTNKRITHENSKGLILGFQHAKNFAIKKLGSKKDILDFDTKKISNAKEIVEEFSYIEEEGAEITTKKVINRFKQQR